MINPDQIVMVAATLSAGMDISAEEAVNRAIAIIDEVAIRHTRSELPSDAQPATPKQKGAK